MDDYEALKRIGEALAADKAADRLAPLAEYQQRYPGHDDLIAREYLIFSDGPSPSASGITLEMLTTQHRHQYEHIGEIARGGMGAIYHVRDETLRRDLAMKMVLGDGGKIDSSSSESQGQLARRFLEEAQITAQLDHPGVVPVHELGADDEGHLFFTMKYVKGRTLGEIFELARAGDASWSRNRVLQVFARVLETLAFAHDKGVIHRDLKPANVMVGDFGEVYVMDWGLAKVKGGSEDAERPTLETVRTFADQDAHLTAVGQVLGTPSYMPLEQALGKPIDGRVDLYAVGAMIYEYLTDRHPYGDVGQTSSHRDVLLKLLKEVPDPIAAIAPEVPAELVAITEKAMARGRPERYADALALAADLRSFVEGRVVAAHATGPWVELKKWVGRNRALAASLAAAIVLLVVGLATTIALNVKARSERELAERESYRAAVAAAVLSHETSAFAKARQILESVPLGRRDWVWQLLAARADEPLLRVEGAGATFISERKIRTITQRGLEEWEIPGGERRLLLPLEPVAGEAAAQLTPDGALIVYSTRDRGRGETRVRVVDAVDGRELKRFVVPSASPSSAMGSSRYVYRDADLLRVRDLRSGEEVASWTVPKRLQVLALDSGETRLAVRVPEQGVLIYDIDDPTRGSLFSVPNPRIRSVAFCVDGTRLVTAESGDLRGRSFPAEIRVWDVATGRPLNAGGIRLPEHVDAVAVTPDGSRIAIPAGRKIHLLDPESGRVTRTLSGLSRKVHGLTLSPAGYAVAVQGGGGAVIWALGEPSTLRGHEGFVYPVAYSPDGRRIASGGWDGDFGKPGCIRIWDAETGAHVASWGELGQRTNDLAFSQDGSQLLTCTRDPGPGMRLHTWDAATGELVSVSEEVCRGCALSPDGAALVTLAPQNLTLTERATDRTQVVSVDGKGFASRPCFSPDGRIIAVPIWDGSIQLLDPETLELRLTLTGHTARVNRVAFSADSRLVLTTAADDSARVWDAQSGREIARLEGAGSEPLCAIFAPGRQRVLTGHRDGRIRIWDLAERKVIAELIGHNNYVYSLALSPDGETVVSGSGDQTVRIWGTRTPAEMRIAIATRDRLSAEVEPLVTRLFDELERPDQVVERLHAELDGRRLEVALQLALAESVRHRQE